MGLDVFAASRNPVVTTKDKDPTANHRETGWSSNFRVARACGLPRSAAELTVPETPCRRLSGRVSTAARLTDAAG